MEGGMTFTIEPIGFVRGGRVDPIDDDWEVAEPRSSWTRHKSGPMRWPDRMRSAMPKLSSCSTGCPKKIGRGALHARGRDDWPLTGIFAQRGKPPIGSA